MKSEYINRMSSDRIPKDILKYQSKGREVSEDP
jgi:hypothetical protein